MATNQYGKLEVTDLDFDTVKDNFKVFLKQQSVFTDYKWYIYVFKCEDL